MEAGRRQGDEGVALLQFSFGVVARPILGWFSRRMLANVIYNGFSRSNETEADDAAQDA